MVLRITDIEDGKVFGVVCDENHQDERNRDGDHPAARGFRQVEPDGSGDGVECRRDNDGVRPAHPIEQENQHGATAGSAHQVEEVHAVNALDGVGNG